MGFINNKDKVGSSLLLLFTLFYLNSALDIPLNIVFSNEAFTARTLPIGLSMLTILFCLIHLFLPSDQRQDNSITSAVIGFQWKRCILMIFLMMAYSLLFEFLGFMLVTFLFLMLGFYILHERRIGLSAIVSASLVLSLWFILTQLFSIYLDSGNLYRMLVGAE